MYLGNFRDFLILFWFTQKTQKSARNDMNISNVLEKFESIHYSSVNIVLYVIRFDNLT